MLRVALLITELDVGGAERQFTQLATGLDRRFFKPRVYALGAPPPAGQDELVERLREEDIPVEFFHARKWWQTGPTVEKLATRWREFQPHVVQTFLFHANVLGAMAAKQAGVPALSLGVRVNDPRWWRAMIERRSARQAARVVSVSRAVASAVVQRWKLRPEQSVVIPNGVDTDRFACAAPADVTRFGVPRGERPLLYVGRLDRQKGADRLVELAIQSALHNRALLIVGGGPLEQKLRARAIKNMHFAGWQANIPALMAASSLLVVPSRYEGMPNALLEAMASGLPVLATPVEGVREVLGDEDHAQALDFNPVVWAAAIEHLTSLPELAKQLGERNRSRVVEQFSVAAMVQQYERLFGGLASNA